MRINCPLNGDDDTCDQVIEISIEAGYPDTYDEPGSGPMIANVNGTCRHVREFNDGSMPDTDYEALLEHALEVLSDLEETYRGRND